jgi:hypothetical protein
VTVSIKAAGVMMRSIKRAEGIKIVERLRVKITEKTPVVTNSERSPVKTNTKMR